jgi:hypothetical protein
MPTPIPALYLVRCQGRAAWIATAITVGVLMASVPSQAALPSDPAGTPFVTFAQARALG